MSCNIISSEAFARTNRESRRKVKRNKNPIAHKIVVEKANFRPYKVEIQLKIFIPVGTAIIMVAPVNYALVSIFRRTVNIWWAQTINRKIPIRIIAQIIPWCPKTEILYNNSLHIWLINRNRGSIRIYTSGWRKNQNKCC